MEELDLKELFNLFWRKKVQIILIVLIFIGLGVIYTVGFTTPKYSASTRMLLTSSRSSNEMESGSITTADITINSKLVATYSELVKGKTLLKTVISNLGIDMSEETLKKNIKVASVNDTELIEITVTNENPEYSEKIANEIAKVFTEQVKEYYKIENVQVVDVAEKPDTPSNINHKKDVAMFAVVGIVISVAYVLIANMLDTTIKAPEDIEDEFDLTVLSAIPLCDNEIQKSKKRGGKRR